MQITYIFYSHKEDQTGFLSNFYGIEEDTSFKLVMILDGIRYEFYSSEAAYQAQKFENNDYRKLISQQKNAGDAAALGRMDQMKQYEAASGNLAEKIKEFRDKGLKIRQDWNDIKDGIMLNVLREKFKQNPHLKEKLLKTGNTILVEHTKNDNYWGDGGDGTGENMLGKLLMKVREEMR